MDVALARSPRSFAQVWVKRAIDTLANLRVSFAQPSRGQARCQHRNEQALESSPDERCEKRSSAAGLKIGYTHTRLLSYPSSHEIDPTRHGSLRLLAPPDTDGERCGTRCSRTHRIARRGKSPVVRPQRSNEPRRLARVPPQERPGGTGLLPLSGLVTLLPKAVGPTASQLEGTGSNRRSGRGH